MNFRLLLFFSLLFCVFSVEAAPFRPLQGVEVVLDQSHGQIFSPYNPAFEGYSAWTRHMVSWGARVRLNSEPLTRVLQRRGAGTALILGINMTVNRYSAATRRAILSFAKRGGGVLVMAEHDNLFGVNTVQNQLTAPLGLHALPTGMFTSRKDTGNSVWIDTGLPAWGLSTVRMYYVTPLVVKAPACPLLFGRKITQTKHRIMTAYRRWGRGVVVLVGDAEFTWNGVSSMGFSHVQNRQWTLQLLRFLSGRLKAPATSRPVSRPASRPSSKAASVSLLRGVRVASKPVTKPIPAQSVLRPTTRPSLLRTSGARQKSVVGKVLVYLHDSGLGLTKKGELREWAKVLETKGFVVTSRRLSHPEKAALAVVPPLHAPLSASELRFLRRFPKLLLVGDGTSDMFRAKPKLKTLFQKLLKQNVVLPMPQDAVTTPFGFRFVVGTVLSRKGLKAPVLWKDKERLWMWRGAVLQPTTAKGWKGWTVLATTDKKTWLAPTLMGVWADNGKHNIPFQPPSAVRQRGGLPVVAYNSRVFAVGDVEWLMSPGVHRLGGRKVMKALLRWLKKGH